LTGESIAIDKPLHASVIAGSYNLSNTVHIQVEKIGDSTRYGQIMQLIEQASMDKPRLSKLADQIAKPFLIVVLGSAFAAAASLWGQDPAKALVTAATVLIVTCPCALSLAAPAAMLASASAFVKKGLLVKNLQAIEDLSVVDSVIFDKTGTLTAPSIRITHIHTRQGITSNEAMSIANTLAQTSTHPISLAIVSHYQAQQAIEDVYEAVETTEHIGQGISARLPQTHPASGAVSGTVKLGSADFCGHPASEKQTVYLADDHGWLANFELSETLKPNAKPTIDWILANGYRCQLLSGDQATSVATVAAQLNIKNYRAHCSPAEKLKTLNSDKAKGHHILMVGDGLNDGPVLASAQVAMAMGEGVALTQAYADIVLTHGDIGLIPQSLLQAKKTMRIIKQNMIWAALYNAICIPLAFMGLLTPWQAGLGMAISSLVVIFNALRLSKLTND